MRLFIALDLDNSEYFKKCQFQLKEVSIKFNAGYTLPDSFHITLKFLGEVSNASALKIVNLLQTVSFNSFKIKTKNLGFFPSEKCVRVVWVGFEDESSIISLQKQMDKVFSGSFPGNLRFKPHLTLERVKFIDAAKKEQFINDVKRIRIEPKEFEVKEFKLIKSVLTKEGPAYKTIKSFEAGA